MGLRAVGDNLPQSQEHWLFQLKREVILHLGASVPLLQMKGRHSDYQNDSYIFIYYFIFYFFSYKTIFYYDENFAAFKCAITLL